jgi:D-arabinose 1-dehydrogenase-like Zn-dependent alcohol dehydrogenase
MARSACGSATTASPVGRRCASSRRTWATRSTAASASTHRVRPLRRQGARGVDPFDAAPLTCAGVTTYKAVKVAGTRSSDLVAVFGVGGLGHLAIQYARIAGGRVVAVDLHDEKLELARELGAEFTVNAAKEDPVEAIQRLGGADQAIALAVSPRAFEQAFARCAAAARSSSSPSRPTTR